MADAPLDTVSSNSFLGQVVVSSDATIISPNGLYTWIVQDNERKDRAEMHLLVEGRWLLRHADEVANFMKRFEGPRGLWRIEKRKDDRTVGARVIPNLKSDVGKIITDLKHAFRRENDNLNLGLIVTSKNIESVRKQILYWNGPLSLSSISRVVEQIPHMNVPKKVLAIMRMEFMVSMSGKRQEFLLWHFEGSVLVETKVRLASFTSVDGKSMLDELCLQFGAIEAQWLVEVAMTPDMAVLELLYLLGDKSLEDVIRDVFQADSSKKHEDQKKE